jgi:hypothetical protein
MTKKCSIKIAECDAKIKFGHNDHWRHVNRRSSTRPRSSSEPARRTWSSTRKQRRLAVIKKDRNVFGRGW